MGELINGKMPEHIKAGLRCRVIGDVECSECAYYGTVLYEIGLREYECDDIDRDAIALIEHLEAQIPKWISVSDQLPEFDKAVIFGYSDKHFVFIGYLDGEELQWYDLEDGRVARPTHWMPLPEPPKEENNGDNNEC